MEEARLEVQEGRVRRPQEDDGGVKERVEEVHGHRVDLGQGVQDKWEEEVAVVVWPQQGEPGSASCVLQTC